jgi:hypothetical protein
MRQVVQPGAIDVMVGGASDCLTLSGQFEVTGHLAKVGRSKTFFSNVEIE